MKGKKKNNSLILLIGIILVAVVFCFLFLNKPSKDAENSIEKEVTDKNAIEKLDAYFSIIEHSNNHLQNIYSREKLDENDELYITIGYILNNKKYTVITKDTIPENYKNNNNFIDSYIIPGCIWEVKFDTINEVYEDLFNKSVTFDKETINSTGKYTVISKERTDYPCVNNLYDENSKKVYFNSCNCEADALMAPSTIIYTKDKYTEDDDYYYMYLYAAEEVRALSNASSVSWKKPSTHLKVNVTKLEGNEDKFDKIVIKFNKDFKIVETKLVK